ncbi:MAG: nitroreductase family protein [Dysgonamonadaceae bacterium]|jgi:nitroreductase|nr:nitroreductase family protein [Dysgonamonadaceae bacterium]
MDFQELIKIRQSDRAYENRTVEREKIETVLNAGRLAPSANNAQSWTFIVVDESELKNRVADACFRVGGDFVKQAPVVIALVAEKPTLISRLGVAIRQIDFTSLDMGIVAAHLCLQAADLGLGSCMLESFNEEKVRQALNIPDNRRLALLISLGYSADKQREKKRKKIEDVVRWNGY